MNQALQLVDMTIDTAPSELLVRVQEWPEANLPLDEKVAIKDAYSLESKLDFVFFRRFVDGRSSQVAAYILDNSNGKCSSEEISDLHHKIWLSGATPLLYVGQPQRVDIYSCAAAPIKNNGRWFSNPSRTIECLSNIIDAFENARQYSSFRLADGTFWDDKRNADLINTGKSAHKALIAEVQNADKVLNGHTNPTARHLLLLTLLLKYLEDREVFPKDWFDTYHSGATSCLQVFKYGGKDAVLKMLKALEVKFNGDIFHVKEKDKAYITDELLRTLARLVCNDLDSSSGQFYLWSIYSFKYIPVEVLSHIYQRFADQRKGAIFTPLVLVNLMLDHIMPLSKLTGKETVFDPTCGSGVFLVSAFRRLVHVSSNLKNKQRLTPEELKSLLNKTIYGIELQPQAAELAAFSLALAICDALKPNVIWEHLRFDKLIGANILVGDYSEKIYDLIKKSPGQRGFDIVIGNPPFISKLTPAMQEIERQGKQKIPDHQIAYFVLNSCAKVALAPFGKMCMLQPAGFIYNKNTEIFRKEFLSSYQTECILDFVSIRGLFRNGDIKVVAVFICNKKPNDKHAINHLTFRRTFSAENQIYFDLDYYDYHKVAQKNAVKQSGIWKANLLGGGRLLQIAQRLKKLPTLKTTICSHGWDAGEGFIVGKKGTEAPWLTGMKVLSTKEFTEKGIINTQFQTVTDKKFASPRKLSRFLPPLLLIKEHDTLPCVFWDNGPLAYKHQVIGISTLKNDNSALKSFGNTFLENRHNLSASCYLLGTRLLVSKSTAPNKEEIDLLPWPENGNWDLASWEQDMLNDIRIYMAEYVRLGQNSKLMSAVSPQNKEAYCDVFLRLMNKFFPNMVECGSGRSDGLMYQAFAFKNNSSVLWLNDEWIKHARSVIFSKHGDICSFHSIRLVRIYDGNALIFIKPDKLRYWIRSIAIRDVDDTLKDIMRGDQRDA